MKLSDANITSEAGTGIIEALCAMVIIAIGVAGSISLCTVSMNTLASSRSFATVAYDSQRIFEDYRALSFTALLDSYGKSYTSIANAETVVTHPATISTKATYEVTLTAIKSAAQTMPEAVRVTVSPTQRRGKLGERTFSFETVIARAG